jgi:hypothetical protein
VLRARSGVVTIDGVGPYFPEEEAYWYVERHDAGDPNTDYVRLESVASRGYYLSLDVGDQNVVDSSKPVTLRNRPANSGGGELGSEQHWIVQPAPALAEADAPLAAV